MDYSDTWRDWVWAERKRRQGLRVSGVWWFFLCGVVNLFASDCVHLTTESQIAKNWFEELGGSLKLDVSREGGVILKEPLLSPVWFPFVGFTVFRLLRYNVHTCFFRGANYYIHQPCFRCQTMRVPDMLWTSFYFYCSRYVSSNHRSPSVQWYNDPLPRSKW